MTVKKTCAKCKTALVILVQDLLFEEKKISQTAQCPICESNIADFQTDGWIYIQTEDKFNKESSKTKCEYPMP